MNDDSRAQAAQAKETIDGCERFIDLARHYLAENRLKLDPASRLFLENAVGLLVVMLNLIRILSCKVMIDAGRAEQLEAANRELKEHLS
jgi:hypothetical protein